jgi:hypothetical protein
MSRWIVHCRECKKEFTHTDMSTVVKGTMRDPFVSPPKPKIPESGTELKCPHCYGTATYRALELLYRAG